MLSRAMFSNKLAVRGVTVGWGLPLVVAVTLVLGGCASGGKVAKPNKLTRIENSQKLERLWSRNVGEGNARGDLALEPLKFENIVYAAAENGTVTAVDASNGNKVWKVKLDKRVTAGPGADGRVVAVGAEDGLLIGLNPEDGSELWRVDTGGELLAAPLVDRGLVVVRSLDGRIRAVSAIDGTQQWILNRAVPRLTLRGNSGLVLKDERILVGLDNGKLMALRQRDGGVLWETVIAVPSGRGDIERMVDIDGRPRAVDSDVYVNSFQGRVASVAAESGRLLWARDLSGIEDLDVHNDALIVTDVEGRIVAYDRFSSSKLWEQDALLNRGVTGPAAMNDRVVVADKFGYLHMIDPLDGKLIGRQRVDRSAIVNRPAVIDGALYVQTSAGKLAVYRSREDSGERRDSLSEMLKEVREDGPTDSAKAKAASQPAAESPAPETVSDEEFGSELEKGFGGGGFRLGN